MDLKTHIGIRVASARRKADLTQDDLAASIGKAVETISNIERGHTLTGLATLEKIARQLKVPIILFFEGYQPEKRLSRDRAELQQRLLDHMDKLKDQELATAVRLIEALR